MKLSKKFMTATSTVLLFIGGATTVKAINDTFEKKKTTAAIEIGVAFAAIAGSTALYKSAEKKKPDGPAAP